MRARYQAAAEEKNKNYMKKIMRMVVMIKNYDKNINYGRRTSTTTTAIQQKRERERGGESVSRVLKSCRSHNVF